MKQIFKKISSVCAAVFCAVSITAAGTAVVWADSEIDETAKAQLTVTAEGLTETIIPLSEEEINAYLESGDGFTESAMQAWNSSKEDLGEKSENQDEAGETVVAYDDGEYTVTVPVAFEKADANFIYIFDKNGTPTSMSVDVQLPMSVTLQRAGMNTVMGIGIVFFMLVFLSGIIYLFKFIPNGENKKAAAPAPAPAAAPAPAVVEETDDTELVAVIAAAIAAAEGTSPDGFVVRSIRKVKRGRR